MYGTGRQPVTAAPVISAAGRHTITYRAIDLAGNIGPAEIITFTLVFTPGQTSPASVQSIVAGVKGDNDWYVSPITITLLASGGQSTVDHIEYDWRQSGWLTYTAPITSYNEGIYLPVVFRFEPSKSK